MRMRRLLLLLRPIPLIALPMNVIKSVCNNIEARARACLNGTAKYLWVRHAEWYDHCGDTKRCGAGVKGVWKSVIRPVISQPEECISFSYAVRLGWQTFYWPAHINSRLLKWMDRRRMEPDNGQDRPQWMWGWKAMPDNKSNMRWESLYSCMRDEPDEPIVHLLDIHLIVYA